ncbi:hypothetical protein [Dysosmobacter sp.]|jgi:hypothetical protein|uniref:hypothetical protein n=1 Tax=Dysosmobacter sp. TaxID=2591382 RepID=UPI003D930E02
MMTFAELVAILEPTGFPWTYHHWDTPPPPPYGVYLSVRDNPFFADNRTYTFSAGIRLEVYSLERDTSLDDKVRAALDAAEIPYDTDYTFLESEGLYESIFEIEV